MDDLLLNLTQYITSGTAAQRRIARYFKDHLSDLPSETASSVAVRLELSPMTVGRFVRALGYQSLDNIKDRLRETDRSKWQPSPAMEQLYRGAAEGHPLAGLVAERIETLHQIYDLASQPRWSEAVEMFLTANNVFLAAHSRSGLGSHFHECLQTVRGNVQFCPGGNGSYIELLEREASDSILIIVDSRHFVKSRLLARMARRAGYRLMLFTTQYNEWAHEFANATLALPPPRLGNLDDVSTITALIETFAAFAAQASGETAKLRRNRIEELEAAFADNRGR